MRGQYSYTINSLETCSFYGKNQTESSDTYPNEFIPFNFLTRQRLTYHWKLGERRVWQMQLWAIQFETLNTAIRSIIILLRWLRSVRVVLMLIYMQCVLCWFQSPNMPCVVCVCVCIQWILQESAGKHLWSRTMRIHSLVWPKTHVNHNAQMLSSWLIKHTRALVVSRIWTILDGHSHVEAGWVIFFFFIKN